MTKASKIKFKSQLNVIVSRYVDNVAELEFAFPLLKKGGYAFAVLRTPDGRFYVARKSVPDDIGFPDIITEDDHSSEELVYYRK